MPFRTTITGHFFVDALDLIELLCEIHRIHTVCDGDVPAVIGDCNIGVALRLRCTNHLLDRDGPVGPVGVHMEVAANIGEFHQLRQPFCSARALHFTAILA